MYFRQSISVGQKTGFSGWSNGPRVRQTGMYPGLIFVLETLRKTKLTQNSLNLAHVQLRTNNLQVRARDRRLTHPRLSSGCHYQPITNRQENEDYINTREGA